MSFDSEEAIRLLDITPDGLAKMAGVAVNGEQNEMDSRTRDIVLNRQLGVLQNIPRGRTDPIAYECCAKHLPALYALFKDQEPTFSAAAALLNFLAYTTIFIRFANQAAHSPSMLMIHMDRIVRNGAMDDTFTHDPTAMTCQLLSTLLAVQGQGLPDGYDSTEIRRVLGVWKRRFRGSFAATVAERCIDLLQGGPEAVGMMGMVKGTLEKDLRKCGADDCSRRTGQEGQPELMQCQRCRSAVYCSKEHQKQAWKGHKKKCFSVGW